MTGAGPSASGLEPRAAPEAVLDAAAPPPLLSLVVCTRDRADHLAELLAGVVAQEGAPTFEVVVVDNGSRDRTPALLADLAADAPFPVVVANEPVPGLGRARNRGIAAARGELVAFTDDDCRLSPGHLAGIAAAFEELDVDWLAGRILAANPGQARVALLEDPTFRWFPPGGVVWVGSVQGANLAVRRDVLVAAGGFDPRLGAGTELRCEDVELCARLAAAGRRGARCPDLVVWHAHGRDASSARALEAANDRARGAFVAQRFTTRDPAARDYLRTWTAHAALRWGWRPCNAARALAATGREARGALHWWTVRAAGPGAGPPDDLSTPDLRP